LRRWRRKGVMLNCWLVLSSTLSLKLVEGNRRYYCYCHYYYYYYYYYCYYHYYFNCDDGDDHM